MLCLQLQAQAATPSNFGPFSDEDDAATALAQYHKRQLENMGVEMDLDGFAVEDLHKRMDLFKLSIGELC